MDGLLEMILDMEVDIEKTKMELEKIKMELNVKESLLSRMREKLKTDSKQKQYDSMKIVPAFKIESQLDLDSLFAEDQSKRSTIIEKIKNLVVQFGEREFTVAHVDKLYKATFPEEIAVDDMSMRPRISTALTRLKDDGMLEMTFTGSGNVLKRYKVEKQVETEENLI